MADNIPNSSPALSSSIKPQPGMAQCSITKKWFPEDELVTFQGQLVGAEGKQILLDRLRTGADAPGALLRPGTAARFWCIFLDLMLLGALGFIVEIAVGMRLWEPRRYIRLEHQPLGLVVVTIEVCLYILYFGNLHGWKGKTLGKMAGHLCVVNLDGTPISKTKAFLRAAVFQFGLIMVLLATFLGMLTGNQSLLNWGIYVSWVWFLLDGVMALADTRMQRTLHDRICGTRVIRDNV